MKKPKPTRNAKGQFLPGHNEPVVLKTAELKAEAYRQYCEHIAKGKAKKSWFFEHPTLSLTWETMEKYIRNDPSTFDPIKKEIAWAKGYQYWEEIVEQHSKGEKKEAVTPALQMVMRNKFGWDKEDQQKSETTMPLIKQIAERWRNS